MDATLQGNMAALHGLLLLRNLEAVVDDLLDFFNTERLKELIK